MAQSPERINTGRKWFEVYSFAKEALSWTYLIPGIPAVIAAVSAYLDGSPLHLVLFFTLGVLAFGTFMLVAWERFQRERHIRGNLAVVEVFCFGYVDDGDTCSVQGAITLRNFGDRPLFTEVSTLNFIIDGRENPDMRERKPRAILVKGQDGPVHSTSVKGLPKRGLWEFKMKTVVRYGLRENALTETLSLTGHGFFKAVRQPDGQTLVGHEFLIDELRQ